jgi:exopolysaccharide biosynthesis polyprenyl glycosylphosphotransferase
MFKRFDTNYMALLLTVDAVLIQLALGLATELGRGTASLKPAETAWGTCGEWTCTWGLRFAVGCLGLICFLLVSAYSPRKIIRWYNELQRLLLATLLLSLSLSGVLYIIALDLPRLSFLYFYLLSTAMIVGLRCVLRLWHRLQQDAPSVVTRILIASAGTTGTGIAQEFRRQQWPGIKLVGFLDDAADGKREALVGLPVLGKLDDLCQVVAAYEIDEVVIALPSSEHKRLINLVACLHELPVRVRVVPDCFELAFFGATVESLGGIPLIGLRDPAIDGLQRVAKRLMDVALSLAGLVVTLPVCVLTAAAIKLEDGGPIFYKSTRVGENGKLFTMWKFRSMRVNADKLGHLVVGRDSEGRPVYKTPDDPRVTRVGRVIRRTSIDELPQLVNVLLGQMSMVGPRPELPWVLEKYEPWQRKRFAVPQGITGWWQVNGRSDLPLHLHTEEDLYYIQNYSLLLDVQILWKTIAAIVSARGAY